jgi:phosphatidylglycerol:prolipoprotein diacylglycerol transferase
MGGFLGALWFTLRHELPVLRLGDAIVPCLFLGVFFGRIGCLMNGCCYGGRCEDGWAALRFPPQSPVYQEQLSSGELLGMNIDPETGRIRSVQSGSVAAELGIESGQTYQGGRADFQPLETADPALPQEQVLPGWILRVSGQTHVLGPEKLPARSLPVRAAQLISSLTGLALCLTLCAASLVFRRPGAIMFGGFASYAVVRFGLEMVRVDEAGQFNTSLSISQWVSIFVFAISVAGLIWLYRRDQEPTEPAVPAATTPPSSGVESTG